MRIKCIYNVLNFGAKENALATKSIQAAIDACSAEGGGRVIIPSGTYVCGTKKCAPIFI